MAQPLRITLSPEQRRELEHARDHHEKVYVRERAAALLKIADGMSGRQVALQGLSKQYNPDTVYAWVRRYQQDGLAGLLVQPGRGRKPAFFPCHLTEEAAREELRRLLASPPSAYGYPQSRWTLALLAKHLRGWGVRTPAGMSELLSRLGLRHKRTRADQQ